MDLPSTNRTLEDLEESVSRCPTSIIFASTLGDLNKNIGFTTKALYSSKGQEAGLKSAKYTGCTLSETDNSDLKQTAKTRVAPGQVWLYLRLNNIYRALKTTRRIDLNS